MNFQTTVIEKDRDVLFLQEEEELLADNSSVDFSAYEKAIADAHSFLRQVLIVRFHMAFSLVENIHFNPNYLLHNAGEGPQSHPISIVVDLSDSRHRWCFTVGSAANIRKLPPSGFKFRRP